MDLVSGLAGLRTAVELTRALRDAAKAGAIKQDEFAGRVGEIYDYISDSKDALVDAKDEIRSLKDEIRKLSDTTQERRTIQSELVPEDNAYFRVTEAGKSKVARGPLKVSSGGRCHVTTPLLPVEQQTSIH